MTAESPSPAESVREAPLGEFMNWRNIPQALASSCQMQIEGAHQPAGHDLRLQLCAQVRYNARHDGRCFGAVAQQADLAGGWRRCRTQVCGIKGAQSGWKGLSRVLCWLLLTADQQGYRQAPRARASDFRLPRGGQGLGFPKCTQHERTLIRFGVWAVPFRNSGSGGCC